jgi:hypothetical protein
MTRTAFSWLIRAHDLVWTDRGFSLPERIAGCKLLWQLIITHHTKPKEKQENQ